MSTTIAGTLSEGAIGAKVVNPWGIITPTIAMR